MFAENKFALINLITSNSHMFPFAAIVKDSKSFFNWAEREREHERKKYWLTIQFRLVNLSAMHSRVEWASVYTQCLSWRSSGKFFMMFLQSSGESLEIVTFWYRNCMMKCGYTCVLTSTLISLRQSSTHHKTDSSSMFLFGSRMRMHRQINGTNTEKR